MGCRRLEAAAPKGHAVVMRGRTHQWRVRTLRGGGIVLITPIMALGVGVGLEEVDAGLGEEAEVVGGPD